MILAHDDGSWPFKVWIDGKDLVILNGRVTCFGGSSDPEDNGETASGISTLNPATRGVALPRRYVGMSPSQTRALGGSAIPQHLPFGTTVEIEQISTGKKIMGPFIDVGPAKRTGNSADLTMAIAKEFIPSASPTNFAIQANIRVINGTQYLTS